MGLWRKFQIYFDASIGRRVRKYAIPALRISVGIVFLWFGLLKILNVSPIAYMIEKSYPFLPFPAAIVVLGVFEFLIGLGLVFKKYVRLVVILLWLQMLGVLGSVVFAPSLFFVGKNLFLLTIEGEFVVKNIIVIAASMVIASYKVPTVDKA